MRLTWRKLSHGFISKIKGKSNGDDEEYVKHTTDENNNVESVDTADRVKGFIEDKYVLSTVSWYWPELSAMCAEKTLHEKPDGTFLVRKSSTSGFMFTVTYKIEGKVGNLRVQCQNGVFCLSFLDPSQPREPTIQGLIEKLNKLTSKDTFACGLKRELNGVTTVVPLKFERPLKRNVTLQDHCRRSIMRQLDDPEDVRKLDLTENMKEFLLELKDEV